MVNIIIVGITGRHHAIIFSDNFDVFISHDLFTWTLSLSDPSHTHWISSHYINKIPPECVSMHVARMLQCVLYVVRCICEEDENTNTKMQACQSALMHDAHKLTSGVYAKRNQNNYPESLTQLQYLDWVGRKLESICNIEWLMNIFKYCARQERRSSCCPRLCWRAFRRMQHAVWCSITTCVRKRTH